MLKSLQVSTRATTNELGFNKPGALAQYFAKRWLSEPSAKGEEIIAWLLEAALGRNALYFIERTKEYVDKWGGSGEIVPENAFDGFVITGDPIEDTLIPHAVLVWTCMNDRPWGEEVYHRWLDELLAAGSAEAAYLAASLWPAHDLMEKVTYRPPGWRVYQGQLDAEGERLILTEMLKGYHGPRASLYGSFEYDDAPFLRKLPREYIKRHGFIHPICGLVWPTEIEWDGDLKKCIQEALAAPSWSEGVKGAAMLLYLSLNVFNELREGTRGILNTLKQNLFKLDERHINIINFHTDKIDKIDYNLIKDYINYLMILCNNAMNKISFLIENRNSFLIKIFRNYTSIGLKTKDILYIGKEIKNIIFNLMIEEKDKVELWIKNQEDDLRIKDILLAVYISKRFNYEDLYNITIDKELKTEQVERKIEDIYGKVKYFDKIFLLINQAKIYFNGGGESYKLCNFIDDILKRELRINFNFNFREDCVKIINGWHPSRSRILEGDIFLESNHIGFYLYYNILREWTGPIINFDKEKELNLFLYIRKKIIKNLYIHTINNIDLKLNLYLNKLESNNLPFKEIIIDLINIIENNYDKISEYFKDESKLKILRKGILYNIDLLGGEFMNSRLIDFLGIDNKSKNMIIY